VDLPIAERSADSRSDVHWRYPGSIELLHELQSHAAWSSDERDPAHPERTRNDLWPPDLFVSRQLSVQVIGKESRVEKPFLRYRDPILVDRAGEEGDHQRTEEHIRALPAAPHHPVADHRSCAFVESASRVHVSDLDRKVRKARNSHRPLPSPWPGENASAASFVPLYE